MNASNIVKEASLKLLHISVINGRNVGLGLKFDWNIYSHTTNVLWNNSHTTNVLWNNSHTTNVLWNNSHTTNVLSIAAYAVGL